jgi:hypothetical protein
MNCGHIVEAKTGRCIKCGEQTSPFDAMEAAWLLRQGKKVRSTTWEPGVHAEMVNGKVMTFVNGVPSKPHIMFGSKPHVLDLSEVLGTWELAPDNLKDVDDPTERR